MNRVTVEVTRHPDHLLVHWTDGAASGSCRFDHLDGVVPEWLGSADELFEGADRRAEAQIVDAVVSWASDVGVQLGIWHDDEGVELLR